MTSTQASFWAAAVVAALALAALPTTVEAGNKAHRILAISQLGDRVDHHNIDDAVQQMGLEDEISAGNHPCQAKRRGGGEAAPPLKVPTARFFPGPAETYIEEDAVDEEDPNWRQVELVSDPFPCGAYDGGNRNVETMLTNMKSIAESSDRWPEAVRFPPEYETRQCPTRRAIHANQATIDMKFSLDQLKRLSEGLHELCHSHRIRPPIETPVLKAAIETFEQCVAPAAKPSKKAPFDQLTVAQKYPLFFKLFQGFVAFSGNGNTVKGNEVILFKFSYADTNNFYSERDAEAKKAYDLVEDYSNRAKLPDGTLVRDCVFNRANRIAADKTFFENSWSRKDLDAVAFKAFWENPSFEHDVFTNPGLLEGTGNIHTQIKPKFNARHEIIQVAFEIRNPNLINPGFDDGWASMPAEAAKDIKAMCRLAWPAGPAGPAEPAGPAGPEVERDDSEDIQSFELH